MQNSSSFNIVVPIEKACTKCGVVKLLSEFGREKRSKIGKSSHCKVCRRSAVDSHYSGLSDEEKKRRRAPYVNGAYCRSANYKKLYGITLEDVRKMHQDQMGLCANRGCGQAIEVDKIIGPHKHKAVVDHNHETGKVRGLLCYKCNTSLGLLEDKNVVLGLTEYLHKYDAIPSHLRGK